MSIFESTLTILHLILTAGFVVITWAHFGISVLNRARIRNVILTWRPLPWRNFPYGPVLFALSILAVEVVARHAGSGIPTLLLFGYGMGAAAWFGAAWISGAAVVNDCGIFANIHSREGWMAWGRVMDYFEFSGRKGEGIVFIHRCNDHRPARMVLYVPEPIRTDLVTFADAQIRLRPTRTERSARGKTALEG